MMIRTRMIGCRNMKLEYSVTQENSDNRAKL